MIKGFRSLVAIAAAMALGLPGVAFAQEDAAAEPRAAAEASDMPALIETSAFASRTEFFNLSVSGQGTKFALTAHKNETDEDGEEIVRDYVVIYDAETRKPLKVVPMPRDRHVDRLTWAGDDRLLMSLSGTTVVWGYANVPVSRMLMYDVPKDTVSYIGRKKQVYRA